MSSSADRSFRELMRRVLAGEDKAADELVETYGKRLQVFIRVKLLPRSSPLRRQLDSADIAQSVMGSFFPRAAAGKFKLDTAGQLVKLLAKMAECKLAKAWQKARREEYGGDEVLQVADSTPNQSRIVENRELWEQVYARMSEEERQLMILRLREDLTWPEIAAKLGGTPDARRQQFNRALVRVLCELGLMD